MIYYHMIWIFSKIYFWIYLSFTKDKSFNSDFYKCCEATRGQINKILYIVLINLFLEDIGSSW